jgi:hypothetical protein
MIDLNKPIECEGVPVEVLTGWDNGGGCKFCLAHADGIKAMDADGFIYNLVFSGKIATNTPPKPNLVGVGDKAYLGDDPYTVIGVDGNRAWIKRHICGTRRVVMISEITLNGLPIDGIRQ